MEEDDDEEEEEEEEGRFYSKGGRGGGGRVVAGTPSRLDSEWTAHVGFGFVGSKGAGATMAAPPEASALPPLEEVEDVVAKLDELDTVPGPVDAFGLLRGMFEGDAKAAAGEVSDVLDAWEASDAVRHVALGRHYTWVWMDQDVVRSAAGSGTSPAPNPTSFATVTQYVLARRAGLLSPPNATASPAHTKGNPHDEVLDVIEHLQSHVAEQHRANVANWTTTRKTIDERVRGGVEFGRARKRTLPDASVDAAYLRELTRRVGQALEKEKDKPLPRASAALKEERCHHCGVVVATTTGTGARARFKDVEHHLGPALTCGSCSARYCRSCLTKTYDQTAPLLAQAVRDGWTCPRCRGSCWCSACIRTTRTVVLAHAFGVRGASATLERLVGEWFPSSAPSGGSGPASTQTTTTTTSKRRRS